MRLTIAAAQSVSIPGDIPKNVARHRRIGAAAAERGVQLLVFPELSLIGYELTLARQTAIHPDSPRLDPLRDLSAQADMIVVAGAPVPNEKGQLHIAAFAFHPDGSVTTYTKQHVHQSEEAVFTSGSGGAALSIADNMVSLAICADATHPHHAASASARGASLYAVGVMIDDAGYARKTALLQGYAQKHSMAVLMSNYSGMTGGEKSAGKSTIWSEDGQAVAASAGTDEVLVIGTRQQEAWTGVVLPLKVD